MFGHERLIRLGLGKVKNMQTIKALETIVRNHPFLLGMDPQLCRVLAGCACIRRFASQQFIFQEGAAADHFYLIISGKVALETLLEDGEPVTIQEIGSGEALGWSWLFPPYQWHFTAVTREPTEVISFDAAVLRDMAARDRELHNELFSRVAESLYHRLLGTRAHLSEVH